MMKLFKVIRRLNTDERGQVVLLSGLMAFLIVIMSIFALNTSRAVSSRIRAQNAVDAAADAAAVWQARGLNLYQHLNNFHYKANQVFWWSEFASLVSCGLTAPALQAVHSTKAACLTLIGCIAYGAAVLAYEGICAACFTAPYIDMVQDKTSYAILFAQDALVPIFPLLTFGAANNIAQQSGADKLPEGLAQYAGDWLEQLTGLPIDMTNIEGESIMGENIFDLVGVYAFPMNPKSLALNVERIEGEGIPWVFDPGVSFGGLSLNLAGGVMTVADVACRLSEWPTAFPRSGHPALPYDDWGWRDEYYWGNPGFMTWMAATHQAPEITGLENLVWLNARRDQRSEIEQRTKAMYSDGFTINSAVQQQKLMDQVIHIPAFLSLASSQVEGGAVTHRIKDMDEHGARGHLIPVHFPPEEDATSGASWLIYH